VDQRNRAPFLSRTRWTNMYWAPGASCWIRELDFGESGLNRLPNDDVVRCCGHKKTGERWNQGGVVQSSQENLFPDSHVPPIIRHSLCYSYRRSEPDTHYHDHAGMTTVVAEVEHTSPTAFFATTERPNRGLTSAPC